MPYDITYDRMYGGFDEDGRPDDNGPYNENGDCECPDCYAGNSDREGNDYGDDSPEIVNDDLPSVSSVAKSAMYVPAIEGRPLRLVSLEQEIGGDGSYAIAALYNAGLTSEPRLWEYGSDRAEFCHVERDGSVDGEIIYSKLRLDHPATLRKLDDAIDVVGGTIADGECRLDSRCGFHVHVGIGRDGDIPCYSMAAVQSLYHLWNYLEDTIYRLASANWDRHRTESGNNYAPPTVKGATGAVQIGRNLQRDRYALNLGNFLGARGYCGCGAFDFGEWSACTCNLPKPTVEFRVFNATANKRKIRAYAALCLALVGYAETHEVTADSHPVFPWAGTGTMQIGTEDQVTRLRFILRELPLTDDEREDIRYCAEKSSLKEVVSGIRRRKGYALSA